MTSLTTSRVICLRSADVVVVAFQSRGRSSPSPSISCRSLSEIVTACSRRHVLFSCSIWSARRSRSSQTRSRERATLRLDGVILATRVLGIVASPLALQRPLPLHCPAPSFDLAQCSHCQGNPVRRQRLQDESLNFSIDRERSRLLALRPPFRAAVGNADVNRIVAVRSRVAQAHTAGAAATADNPLQQCIAFARDPGPARIVSIEVVPQLPTVRHELIPVDISRMGVLNPTASLILPTHLPATRTLRQSVQQSAREADTHRGD